MHIKERRKNKPECFSERLVLVLVLLLELVLALLFGPGVLACATRGGGRSEAGHCFHRLFLFFLKGLPWHKTQVQSQSHWAKRFTNFGLPTTLPRRQVEVQVQVRVKAQEQVQAFH